jgi:hypothetical protein
MRPVATTNDNVVVLLSTLVMPSAIIVSIADSNVVGNLVDILVKK